MTHLPRLSKVLTKKFAVLFAVMFTAIGVVIAGSGAASADTLVQKEVKTWDYLSGGQWVSTDHTNIMSSFSDESSVNLTVYNDSVMARYDVYLLCRVPNGSSTWYNYNDHSGSRWYAVQIWTGSAWVYGFVTENQVMPGSEGYSALWNRMNWCGA